MMKKKLSYALSTLFMGAWLFTALLSTPASAVLVPQPLAADPRVKVVSWAPNEVIKYTGYYRVQTSWEFAPDENVATISMGDSMAWMINPMGNRLFIKPIEEDATTNMTIITNKRLYLIELHAEHAEKIDDKNVTWILKFVYPGEDAGFTTTHLDGVPDLQTEDLSKYNFRYTVSGSQDITPLRIFDDGEFTYFEFRDINGEIPAFYMVDSLNNEQLINYRTRGPYIVVERVTARYTLRHGNSVVCVFNEAMSSRHQSGGNGSGSTSSSPAGGGGTAVNAGYQK
jgi:type IV secretion system protein VirB9